MHKFVNRWRSINKSVYSIWNTIALNNLKDTNFGYKGLFLLILVVISSNDFKNTNFGPEKQHSFGFQMSTT